MTEVEQLHGDLDLLRAENERLREQVVYWRGQAQDAREAWRHEVADQAVRIAELEAECERLRATVELVREMVQSLKPEEITPYAERWLMDALDEEDRP